MDRKGQVLCAIAFTLLLSACGGGGAGGSGGGSANSSIQGGSGSSGAALPTNTASGTVMFNGVPLAGATVVAYSTNTNTVYGSVTTDASGMYSFGGMMTSCTSPGCVINYQFFVYKAGYAFNPVMASNPTGDRSKALWNDSGHDWYVDVGAIATREDFNGSFTSSYGGTGIEFNVINLNSTPNNSITGANFDAYDGRNPTATLAATGQGASYAAGDDGALKKGVAGPAQRFVDNQDGTVTDQLTGLVWLRTAGCFAPTQWAGAVAQVNALASGSCGLTDGSKAGDWRMPNVVEFESVLSVATSSPALPAGHPFTQVSMGIYWTSTSYYGGLTGSPNAWAMRMSDGRYINDTTGSNLNLKTTASNAVWAVKGSSSGPAKLQASGAYVPYAAGDDGTVQRGMPLPTPRMIDNGNGTVTDTATGLVWLKKADCIRQDWAGALAAVNAMASGQCGLSDGSAAGSWRMPNRKEMQSLADRAQNNMAAHFGETFTSRMSGIPSQPAVFTNFIQLEYYWTSSTVAGDTSLAWTVYSCDWGVYDTPKSSVGYVLAVR
ncbi:DUF1566 domain-containing protein [Burkholderiaceae bacterium UC74_6]